MSGVTVVRFRLQTCRTRRTFLVDPPRVLSFQVVPPERARSSISPQENNIVLARRLRETPRSDSNSSHQERSRQQTLRRSFKLSTSYAFDTAVFLHPASPQRARLTRTTGVPVLHPMILTNGLRAKEPPPRRHGSAGRAAIQRLRNFLRLPADLLGGRNRWEKRKKISTRSAAHRSTCHSSIRISVDDLSCFMHIFAPAGCRRSAPHAGSCIESQGRPAHNDTLRRT